MIFWIGVYDFLFNGGLACFYMNVFENSGELPLQWPELVAAQRSEQCGGGAAEKGLRG